MCFLFKTAQHSVMNFKHPNQQLPFQLIESINVSFKNVSAGFSDVSRFCFWTHLLNICSFCPLLYNIIHFKYPYLTCYSHPLHILFHFSTYYWVCPLYFLYKDLSNTDWKLPCLFFLLWWKYKKTQPPHTIIFLLYIKYKCWHCFLANIFNYEMEPLHKYSNIYEYYFFFDNCVVFFLLKKCSWTDHTHFFFFSTVTVIPTWFDCFYSHLVIFFILPLSFYYTFSLKNAVFPPINLAEQCSGRQFFIGDSS